MNLMLLNRYDFLGRFAKLATTNVLSQIVVPVGSLIGLALLGHLPNINYLTGVALGHVLFQQLYGMFGFLRMSTTGLTAQAVGKDDRQEVLLVGIRYGILAIAIGILLIMLQYPLRELGFTILNATGEVRIAANAYFNIRIWGAPILFMNWIFTGWLLGQEQQKKVLLLSLGDNIGIIVLNYLFIVQLNWGSAGVGLSLVLSNGFIFVLTLALLWRELSFREIQKVVGGIVDWSALKISFNLNTNLFLRSILSRGVFFVVVSVGATIGNDILTENSLLIQMFSLTVFISTGLGLATETLAANFKGQNSPERLWPLLQVGLGISFLMGLICSSISLFFPRTLLGLLTNHTELINQAIVYIPWFVGFIIFSAIVYLLDGYFAALAAGDAIRNATFLGVFLGFIPFAFWSWHEHSNHLLWLALLVDMAIRAFVMLFQVPKTLVFKEDTAT